MTTTVSTVRFFLVSIEPESLNMKLDFINVTVCVVFWQITEIVTPDITNKESNTRSVTKHLCALKHVFDGNV